MKVYLIGVGMGNPATLTGEALEAIRQSAVLVGAERLLAPQRNFLEDHLASWVPLMTADLRRFAQCGLYRGLASLTDGFIQVEQEFFDEIFGDEDEAAETSEAEAATDAAGAEEAA